MLSIKALRNLWLFISLGLSTLLFPNTSFAALIDVQQKNDIVYFLFAAPNKIIRYDLSSNAFLTKISLDKIPTAFHVSETKIYTSYDKEIVQSDIRGSSSSSIYQAVSEIKHLTLLGDYLYCINSDNRTKVISTDTYTEVSNNYYSTSATDLVASPIKQSVYSVANYSRTPSKATLDASGKITRRINSQFGPSGTYANTLYLHPSENEIYSNKGFIYSAEDLSFLGTLTGDFTDMTFLGNRPVVIRENHLFIYSEDNLDSKSVLLDHTPHYVAAKDKIITSFVTSDSLVSAHQTHIDLLIKPTATSPKDPSTTSYITDLMTTDNNNIVYLVDKDNLAIHRRKAEEKEFANSWGLVESPNRITYSKSHERLYLGYQSGKITYFDTTKADTAEEIHFVSLTSEIRALVSAGDYLFAKDGESNSYTYSYSIDKDGMIINHRSNNEHSEEYVWNHLNDYIYQLDTRFIRWTELLSSDGNFGIYKNSNYNSESNYKFPLRISPNGQILLLGSGEIIGTNNQTILNNLANSIDDAAWINGNLITMKEGTNTLQFWQEDYLLTSEHQLSKTNNTRLFNLNKKLLIVKQLNTRPIFIYTDTETISDSDDDSINDFDDNCEFKSNSEQEDFDQDDIGDICDDDSDNDSIPNDIEITAGLDPLNKEDAALDLDGDDFSNLVEYFYATDINDNLSKPAIISELNESFEKSIPAGLYNLEPLTRLTIATEEDESYLSIPISNQATQPISLFYTAEFEQGILGFKHSITRYSYNYTLEIIIDGELKKTQNVYSSWNTSLINLEKGVHTVEFKFTSTSTSNSNNSLALIKIDDLSYRLNADSDSIPDETDNCPSVDNPYQQDSDNDGVGNACDNDPYGQDKDADGFGDSKDNCPDIYNPDQLNIDNDYYGDACDDLDDRPSDVDQDGIPDYLDNCPNTANPEQKNFDNDYFGDLCDLDSDNDGLLNSIEDQYDFLNSFDPNDALLDYDNDGASNQYELNNNLSADKVDTFEDINLLDYYPVGILDYFYVTDNRFIRTSMTTTETPGRFKVSSTNDIEIIIERRSSGIYLLSSTYTDFDMTFLYENFQLLPSRLKPGHVFTSNNSAYREGSSDVIEGENTFYITNVGEKAWRGKTYPSVTLMIDGIEKTFLKGIGEASIQQLELDSVNFDFIEAPEVVAPEKSKSKAGALSPVIFFFFTIMAIATRIRRQR